MGRYRLSACGLTLALTAFACGGKIAGETDPIATRVTGTKTGTPQPPEDGPTPLPPGSEPAPPSNPPTPPSPPPPGPATPPPFAWSGTCPATPPPSQPPAVPASIDETRAAMVGHWTGIATTPWVAPYDVHLAFEADGHYASRSSSTISPAFYYGTDLDTALKQWSLTDLSDAGAARGKIDIAFQYGPSFGLPLWQGVLSDVIIDAAHSRLQLSFSTSDGYGPILYDLWRCP